MTGHRLACLGLLVAGGAAALAVACSGSRSPAPGGSDAAVADATSPEDAGPSRDAGPVDARAESSLKGGCEPLDGSCDLVLQSCPSGSQCVAEALPDGGGYTAACGPTYGVQHIAAGYPCCPPATSDGDPCLPGTRCAGDPCVGDAGGGRCSPYCCAGDDTPCGVSPEGFTGHCDLAVVGEGGAVLYDVCEYAPVCQPLGLLPCPSGYTCLVEGTSGGAKCSPIYNGGAPPAGEGQPCPHVNACASGLMCLTTSGADGGPTSECFMLCFTGQGSPPFDAGALGMMPGTGTCDPGKQCATATQIFPAWLGVCVP